MPRSAGIILILCFLAGAVMFAGCDEDVYIDTGRENRPPTVRLTNGPLEGETTQYLVHFFWLGYDPDGTVDHYEYVITSGDPIGFSPEDTTGLEKWTQTTATDKVFKVSADSSVGKVTINNALYTKYSRTHTLFLRAVDDRGARSEAAYRSFTAFTLAPSVVIVFPEEMNPGFDAQYLTPIITFKWVGKDPIDSPWNYQNVDSVRYMYTRYSSWIMDDLNENPEKYELKWSNWISSEAPGDSGTSTVLGDDELIELGHTYIFAVQAKDEAGAVTSIFDTRTNVRCFIAKKPTGPLLTVNGFGLTFRFMGDDNQPEGIDAPAGIPVSFSWTGDASHYGAIVSTYRYGWDISDLNEPGEWDVSASPFHTATPEISFYSGVHSLYIEAVDNLGVATLARIEISIVPLVMDRNLLWVDDFMLEDFPQILYAMPTESAHDQFWIDICSRAEGFDPGVDIYDTREYAFQAPSIKRLWRYKNIIWIFGGARYDFNTWMQIVRFTGENYGQTGQSYYNMLSYYMKFGGHMWTLGKSDREGGFISGMYIPRYNNPSSMVRREYCVTVVDEVYGAIRPDFPDNIVRDIDMDAMHHAYKDGDDPITNMHPGLPDELCLWDEVTRPNRFFDPQIRGFHYLEIFDPKYWMREIGRSSQSCFHPMYRMMARNTRSVLHGQVIAFWTTKYADVEPDPPGTVAAPSVHFGLPLWYFNRDQANAIADEIFKEWKISKEQ